MCSLLRAQTQTPILEREISVKADNESIQFIMDQIATQANFTFSYSPEQINTTRRVSLDIRKRSVRFALNALFEGEVEYKPRGKYLILKAIPPPKKEDKKPATVVEGYLFDAQTGEGLSQASVYSKQQLASAITDQYGYFRLLVPAGESTPEIQVSKQGYQDTLLIAIDKPANFLDLELTGTAPASSDSLTTPKPKFHLPTWLVSQKILINQRNITDTLYTKYQFSLAPLLNTNKLFSGRTVTDYSFNATIGFTKEVRIFEAGAIANIVTGNASKIQLAGLGNFVGGNMNGLQASGIINIANEVNGIQTSGIINLAKKVNGIQAAGTLNAALNHADMQIAGTLNFAPKVNHLQLAGIINLAGEANNMQVAGISNLAMEVKGMQVAGIVNVAGQVEGVQVAGICNRASSVSKLQASAIYNDADSIMGVQAAAILNRTGFLKGLQLGLINIADTCQGIPVGLLSFVRRGGHNKIEIYSDEMFLTNAAIRLGVKRFHNVIMFGKFHRTLQSSAWMLGYGLGTSFPLTRKLSFDIDYFDQSLYANGNLKPVAALKRINAGIDWHINPKFSMMLGPTFNLLIPSKNTEGLISEFKPPYNLIDDASLTEKGIQFWIGARIGLRFF